LADSLSATAIDATDLPVARNSSRRRSSSSVQRLLWFLNMTGTSFGADMR